jgi:diguanylate cyclase (GGDEF)-like protein
MLEPSLKSEVESLVARSPWFVTIPPALHARYRQGKLEHFARLARYGAPLLVLLYIGLNVLTLLLYGNSINGSDLYYWIAGDISIGLTILVGVTLAQIPRFQASYTQWVPVLLTITLIAKIICALGIQHPAVAHNDIYIALVIIAVGNLTLGLPTRLSLAASLIAMLTFPVALLFIKSTPYLLEFVTYYVTVTLIFSGISVLAEHQSYMSFLQSILIEHQNCEVQRLNDELGTLARQDPLSGLANRRAFDENLAVEWNRAHRQHTDIALLMIDVDHFKLYNDTYGHPAGDSCLARVAAVLAGNMRRPGDMAARYGGEEFALLLPGTDGQGASEVAQRLLAQIDALALPHASSPTAAHVTISIGIAAGIPPSEKDATQLIDDADAALYQAKRSGRHRYSSVQVSQAAATALEQA